MSVEVNKQGAPSRQAVHDAVWRWDPLAVTEHLPATADEYDDLIDRLWLRLRDGSPAPERQRAIDQFIEDCEFSGPGEAQLREWAAQA